MPENDRCQTNVAAVSELKGTIVVSSAKAIMQ